MKAKIENFLYYYKWHSVGILLLILFITFGTMQYVNKKDNKFSVAFVSATGLDGESHKKLETALGNVEIKEFIISPNASRKELMLNQSLLIAEMVSGNSRLYIADMDIIKAVSSDEEFYFPLDEFLKMDGIKNEKGQTIAISAKGSKLLEDIGIDTNYSYMFVRNATTQIENMEESDMRQFAVELIKKIKQ